MIKPFPLCDATSGLEKQRREAQGILYDMKEDDEERTELEEERLAVPL